LFSHTITKRSGWKLRSGANTTPSITLNMVELAPMPRANVSTATAVNPGVLAELAETIAAIGEHGAEPVAKPFFANLFFHLFDPSKFDPHGPLCFLRRHACANVFIGQHFQVGINLLVEV